MRVAVVDVGTNSTRLLIADVTAGRVAEILRRSTVTRLGEGVDGSGRLADAAQERVFAVLDEYADAVESHGCERKAAVLTSAVRDASNGAAFADEVLDRYGLAGGVIPGEREARLTFLGATAALDSAEGERVAVVDIGGGSTEIVVGSRGSVEFHTSTQVGVVRHTERHLRHDPPRDPELAALRVDVGSTLREAVPAAARKRPLVMVAVAGTATSAAAIDLGGFDAARVEGHRLSTGTLRLQLDRLVSVPLQERRAIPGLHPDRAPTIVAGLAILLEALVLFGLDEVRVSDRDILWGAALELAGPEGGSAPSAGRGAS